MPGFHRPSGSGGGSQGSNSGSDNSNATSGAGTTSTSVPTELPDDPAGALQAVATFLGQQGYTQASAAMHYRSFPPGGVVAHAVNARPGHCYAIVAIGNVDASMRLAMVNARQETVSFQLGNRPWVEGCTRQQGRLRTRLQHVSGPASLYYAVFQSTQMRVTGLQALLGQRNTQTADLTPDAEVQQRMTQLAESLGADGYAQTGPVLGLSMDDNAVRDFRLTLQGETCYAFATLGGTGTQDTDLWILDPDGNSMTSDISGQRDALVRDVCPSTAGQYTFRTRLYSGTGPVFRAAFSRRAVSASASSEPDATETVIDAEATEGADLNENHERISAGMRARGYETFGDESRARLDAGEHQDFSVRLEGGRCYAILAVGDNAVRDLDLTLLNAQGRELDQDEQDNAEPIVRVCPSETTEVSARVEMTDGVGEFIYSAHRWTSGTRGAWGLEGLLYVRHAELSRLLDVDEYEADVSLAPERGRIRRRGEVRRHRIELEAGACYTAVAVGGSGVQDLDMRVSRGPRASQLAGQDNRANAFPQVQFCPQQGGTHQVELTGVAGTGNYFFQVFRRRDG
jgi:hypothetical protein